MTIYELEELLGLPDLNIDAIEQGLNIIISGDTEDFSKDPIAYAQTMYSIFVYCQKLIDEGKLCLPLNGDFERKLLTAYRNIRRLPVDTGMKLMDNGSMAILYFLSCLEDYGKGERESIIEDDFLKPVIEILLCDLNEIRFLFLITEDEHQIFPIHSMVSKIIDKEDFFDANPITIYQIQILQLAVQLFTNDGDEKKRLEHIKDKCNLKFISYLEQHSEIIDTLDRSNFYNNGVMIFYNGNTNSVLIRHEREDYFQRDIKGFPKEKISIEIEKDIDGIHNIGCFMEYQLEDDDLVIDFSEALKDEFGRKEFIKIIYDWGVRNILLEKSIVRKANGALHPLNPFAIGDRKIIKGRLNSRNSKSYDRENLPEAIQGYLQTAIKKEKLNILTVGTCVALLEICNTGVEKLGIDTLLSNNWFQFQVIQNWMRETDDKQDCLNNMLQKYYKDLSYCENKNLFQNHSVKSIQYFLPYQMDFEWVFSYIGCDTSRFEYLLVQGTMRTEENGRCIEIIVSRKEEGGSQKRELRQIYMDDITDTEDNLKNYSDGAACYCLYCPETNLAVTDHQMILKNLYAIITQLKPQCLLKRELNDLITEEKLRMILKPMDLFDNIFKQFLRFIKDLLDQKIVRIIHNMIWSDISKDNLEAYVNVIHGQQLLSFNDIKRDKYFLREEEGVLYVPKDDSSSDGTLYNIYLKYLKNQTAREENPLYDGTISISEDGIYTVFGKRIQKIIFLFDNFEKGTGTCDALRAYMGESDRRALVNSRQKYYCGETLVTIKEILEKNPEIKVHIHAFYGTAEGKKHIDEKGRELFEMENGNHYEGCDYEKEINKKASGLYPYLEYIPTWKTQSIDDYYAVIRELNMTKKSMFPNEMLKNPGSMITLFVKKSERTDRG